MEDITALVREAMQMRAFPTLPAPVALEDTKMAVLSPKKLEHTPPPAPILEQEPELVNAGLKSDGLPTGLLFVPASSKRRRSVSDDEPRKHKIRAPSQPRRRNMNAIDPNEARRLSHLEAARANRERVDHGFKRLSQSIDNSGIDTSCLTRDRLLLLAAQLIDEKHV